MTSKCPNTNANDRGLCSLAPLRASAVAIALSVSAVCTTGANALDVDADDYSAGALPDPNVGIRVCERFFAPMQL
jgi:hypothetical protein